MLLPDSCELQFNPTLLIVFYTAISTTFHFFAGLVLFQVLEHSILVVFLSL